MYNVAQACIRGVGLHLDIRGNESKVLFAGNFRQQLPVIESIINGVVVWEGCAITKERDNGKNKWKDFGYDCWGSKIYTLIDIDMANDDSTAYPIDTLNSLRLPGVPSHKLELKGGVLIILMRNLNAPRLWNVTRLRLKRCQRGECINSPSSNNIQ